MFARACKRLHELFTSFLAKINTTLQILIYLCIRNLMYINLAK
jgi:hypothetical protein